MPLTPENPQPQKGREMENTRLLQRERIITELCAACGCDTSDGTLPVDWGELHKDVWSSPEREVKLQGQTAMQTCR